MDPVATIERWREFGGDLRVLHVSDEAAIVQLTTCSGEPVERLESRDRALVEYLRALDDPS